MGTVLVLLVAGSVLVAVRWVSAELRRAPRLVRPGSGPGPAGPARVVHLGASAAAAVAHAEGIAGMGRYDDRRCTH